MTDDARAPVQEEPAVVPALAPAPFEEPAGVELDIDGASAVPPSADALVDPPAAEPVAEPVAEPGSSDSVVSQAAHDLFGLHESGQIHGDVAQARHTAEAMLYIARVSEAMGLHMGAGALEAIEVYGSESAYAVVTTDADGSLSVSGCLSTSGTPPEQLREWHRTRTRP